MWGLLTYGLTKGVMDTAALFGLRIPGIPGIGESVLYGVMLLVSAWLLLQMHEASLTTAEPNFENTKDQKD